MRKKEWWEKELQFESIFASGRYAKNLWKYIPERLVEAIDDVSVDSDGYWIYLNDGWNEDGERTIHVYTINDIKNAIKGIQKDS